MKKEPLVSIIIVNWNGGTVFRDCLSSLSKILYKNYELIVFDNGSSDNSLLYAKKSLFKNKKLTIVKSKKNLGFVGGNNLALKKAKGKYILLLNNDTKVPNNFLNILITKMEGDMRHEIGALQPKIFVMDKHEYLDNAGSFITKIGFLKHWGFGKKDGKQFEKEKEIFAAKGACLLIRKEVIEKTNLFDEDFFNYFEESDLCWRIWLYGYKILFYPKTHIYHKIGYTIKRQNVLELNYHYYKNRICSQIKNLDNLNLIKVLTLHLFLSFGIAFIFLIRGSIENSLLIFRAIWWNIINLNKTLKKRKKIQKERIVNDKYIFNKVGKEVNLLKLLLFKDSFFKDFKRIEKDIQKNKK